MVSAAGARLTPKEKEIFGTRLDPGARQAAGSSTYTAEASWTKFASIGWGALAVEGVEYHLHLRARFVCALTTRARRQPVQDVLI